MLPLTYTSLPSKENYLHFYECPHVSGPFWSYNLLKVQQKSISLVDKTMWRKSRLISGSILTVTRRLEAQENQSPQIWANQVRSRYHILEGFFGSEIKFFIHFLSYRVVSNTLLYCLAKLQVDLIHIKASRPPKLKQSLTCRQIRICGVTRLLNNANQCPKKSDLPIVIP